MAYDSNGNYYFNPEIDSEDADALAQVDRQEYARQYRQQQAQGQAYRQTMESETLKVLEEMGITPEQWQEINRELPVEDQKRAVRRSTRKYVRKAIGQAARRKIQGATVTPKSERKTAAPKAVESAREKISEGGQLNSSEEMDILSAILGDDFKL